jgi:hypothetical protein
MSNAQPAPQPPLRKFLSRIHPNGEPFYVSAGAPGPTEHLKCETPEAVEEFIAKHQACKRNTWFRVGCAGAASGKDGALVDSDVTRLHVLIADIDAPPIYRDMASLTQWQADTVAMLQSDHVVKRPSMIWISGNGVQAVWCIEGGVSPEDFTTGTTAIAKRLQNSSWPADAKIKNPSRLLRLPAGKNWKRQIESIYPTAKIIDVDGPSYTLADFEPHFSVERQLELQEAAKKEAQAKRTDAIESETEAGDGGDAACGLKSDYRIDFMYLRISPLAKWAVRMLEHGPREIDKPRFPRAGITDESDVIYAIVHQLLMEGNTVRSIRRALMQGTWSRANLVNKKDSDREIDRKLVAVQEKIGANPFDEWTAAYNAKYTIIESSGGVPEVAGMTNGPQTFGAFETARGVDKCEVTVVTSDGGEQRERKIKFRPAEYWLDSKRSRRFEAEVFEPGRSDPGRCINTWRGWGITPAPPGTASDTKLWDDFLLDVICAGDAVANEYMWNWLAHIFQRPWELPGTALVLNGVQGIGKNSFADAIANMIGKSHYAPVVNAKQIFGDFNGQMKNKVLTVIQEAFFAGNPEHSALLKTRITDQRQSYNEKYKRIEEADSYLRYVILTNNDQAIFAEATSRRYLCLKVSDKYRTAPDYWINFQNTVVKNDKYLACLLRKLLDRDISKFNPRVVPQTAELAEQKKLAMTPEVQAILDLLQNKTIPGAIRPTGKKGDRLGGYRIDTVAMRSLINAHLKHCKTAQAIKKLLVKFCGVQPIHSNSRDWFEFPSLVECRKTFATAVGVPDLFDKSDIIDEDELERQSSAGPMFDGSPNPTQGEWRETEAPYSSTF